MKEVCDHCHGDTYEDLCFIKWPAMDYDQEQWICKECYKHYAVWRNRNNPEEVRNKAFKKLWERPKQVANSYKFIMEE